jgi:hypothetical protein
MVKWIVILLHVRHIKWHRIFSHFSEEQSNEAKIIDKIDMYIFVELFGKDLHFLDFIKWSIYFIRHSGHWLTVIKSGLSPRIISSRILRNGCILRCKTTGLGFRRKIEIDLFSGGGVNTIVQWTVSTRNKWRTSQRNLLWAFSWKNWDRLCGWLVHRNLNLEV